MLARVCREDVENLEGTLAPTSIASPASDVDIEDISLLVFTILDWFCELAYLLLSTSGRERHCVVWHCHHRSRVGAQDMFTSKHMKRATVSLAIVVIVIAPVFSNPTYGARLRPTMNGCCSIVERRNIYHLFCSCRVLSSRSHGRRGSSCIKSLLCCLCSIWRSARAQG